VSPEPTVAVLTGADALAQAVRSDADWLWLLADGARPAADALERLLDQIQPDGEPPAAIVAGLVVDDRDQVIVEALPSFRQSDEEAVVRLVAQRLLPIRSTPFAHCLVARDCLVRHGPPDTAAFGPYAPAVWSAQVLSAAPGYFTPLSLITAPRGTFAIARDHRAAIRGAVRAARSGAWTRGDGVRALARLVPTPRRGCNDCP
jgi:hypothetical protein